MYPAQFFPNALDLTLRKVAIELIVYLPAEMRASQLIVRVLLHLGIYKARLPPNSYDLLADSEVARFRMIVALGNASGSV